VASQASLKVLISGAALTMLEFDCSLKRGDFSLEVAFSVPSPGVTALFGRSGAGKSTVVALLAGLLTPARGRIALGDSVLLDTATGINVPAEDRAVGCVFQDARLFPHLNVRHNLEYGLRRIRGRQAPIRLETVVELLGLESLLARRIRALSGGERQRVALGRALLAQPRLLLLDEPLASLDAERRDEVLPYLDKLRGQLGMPMVYVSHEYDEVLRLAEHLVLLDRGREIASGPVREMCLSEHLHAIVGPKAVGTVLDGVVDQIDTRERLATIRCGELSLRVPDARLESGSRVRLHVPADDVLIALERPRQVSARNVLPVEIRRLENLNGSILVHMTAQGTALLARVTHSAARELGLKEGNRCFALVKAVATQGRRFDRRGAAP
jgi:molybdate transport system ATP-binding protein